MDDTSRQVAELAHQLRPFIDAASAIWNAYLQSGPYSLDPELYRPLDAAAGELQSLARQSGEQEVVEAVGQLCELARRCVSTPMGLCFVTGEAGLIPRRDQHAAYENALEMLRKKLV